MNAQEKTPESQLKLIVIFVITFPEIEKKLPRTTVDLIICPHIYFINLSSPEKFRIWIDRVGKFLPEIDTKPIVYCFT